MVTRLDTFHDEPLLHGDLLSLVNLKFPFRVSITAAEPTPPTSPSLQVCSYDSKKRQSHLSDFFGAQKQGADKKRKVVKSREVSGHSLPPPTLHMPIMDRVIDIMDDVPHGWRCGEAVVAGL